MRKGLLAVAVALMMLVPLTASAEMRGGHGDFDDHDGGGVFISPGFGGYWGSGWGLDGGWGGGWGWGPAWNWGPSPIYYHRTGQIKLDTHVNDAKVYVNGGYVGTTHDNKTLRLRPGAYQIAIREDGHVVFSQNVYVQAGKTLRLHPNL